MQFNEVLGLTDPVQIEEILYVILSIFIVIVFSYFLHTP